MKNSVLKYVFSIFMITLLGCDKITDKEILEEIESLKQNQVLILTNDGITKVDGLTTTNNGTTIVWPCIGTGISFVKCTQGLVDNSGCAKTVPHPDNPGEYCSRPCD